MSMQVPVSANVTTNTKPIDKGLDDLGKTVDRISRKKWNPIDLKAFRKDLASAEKLASDFIKKLGSGKIGINVTGGAAPALPTAAPATGFQPVSPPASQPRWPGRRGSREPHAYVRSPELADVVRSFSGGVGGGFSAITTSGIRGAYAGSREGGGMFGGGVGLMKGVGIGALALGALKAGQAVGEGYEMAAERSQTIDTLMRQMGELSGSFDELKAMTDVFASSIGKDQLEFAKLAAQYNRDSRGADSSSPGQLGMALQAPGGLARSFGIDAGAAASFIGGMRSTDRRQNNRELAFTLADTLNSKGMLERSDEVMSAIKSFADTTARLSLSSPNVSAYAGSLSSLVGTGAAGMDPTNAAALLAQANSSISQGGGAGIGGRAFLFRALTRHGGMNPYDMDALLAGGMFGTRAGVFSEGSELSKYLGEDYTSKLRGGPGSEVTNMQAIKEMLRLNSGGNRQFELTAFQSLAGLNSPEQAAALLNMDPTQSSRLASALGRAGVNYDTVNMSGLKTLSSIANASGMGGLDAIYSDMRTRTGASGLTRDERASLDSARGKGEEEFRNALIRIASSKDREETDATKQQDALVAIKEIQLKVGDKLYEPLNEMRHALVGGSGKTPYELQQDYAKQRAKGIEQQYQAERFDVIRQYGGHQDAWSMWMDPLPANKRAERDKRLADVDTAHQQKVDSLSLELTIHNNIDGKTQSSTKTRATVPVPAAGGKAVMQ